ncbi:MAG: class II aldolase/adducin family protein, partial [Christensenellales bacterium]
YGTTHADYFYGTVPVTRNLTAEEIDRAYEAETGTVIIEAFAGRTPEYCPAVLVRGHGPFTWGTSAMDSVHNAVVLEECCKMAVNALSINPNMQELPRELRDKHFYRKHGPNAYYGQK